MENKNLNIENKEDKFIITIDKKQLDSDYILRLMNWLHLSTLGEQNLTQKKSLETFDFIKTQRELSGISENLADDINFSREERL